MNVLSAVERDLLRIAATITRYCGSRHWTPIYATGYNLSAARRLRADGLIELDDGSHCGAPVRIRLTERGRAAAYEPSP